MDTGKNCIYKMIENHKMMDGLTMKSINHTYLFIYKCIVDCIVTPKNVTMLNICTKSLLKIVTIIKYLSLTWHKIGFSFLFFFFFNHKSSFFSRLSINKFRLNKVKLWKVTDLLPITSSLLHLFIKYKV